MPPTISITLSKGRTLRIREKEFGMKKRLLSILVAILFTVGAIALPISASAQGTSGQMTEEGTAKKSTAKKSAPKKSKTKKSKKQKKSKKPSSTKKSKSKKSQEQQA
jgi:hypothetical protein